MEAHDQRLSDLAAEDYKDRQENKEIDRMFKENYLALCQIYNEVPITRLIKNLAYDYQSKYLVFDHCNICEKSLKSVLHTLYSISEDVYGISFSHN